MEPIKFDGANVVYGAEQPEYQPLPAERVGKPETGQINTCWALSPDELKKVQETGQTGNHCNPCWFQLINPTFTTRNETRLERIGAPVHT